MRRIARVQFGGFKVDQETATYLAGLAWGHLCPQHSEYSAEAVRAALVPILEASVVQRWLQEVDDASVDAAAGAPIESIQHRIDDTSRRSEGIFLTPTDVARGLAEGYGESNGEYAVDLSAGAGTLLSAVIERHPRLGVVGVEQRVELAVAAAINVAAARQRSEQVDHPDDAIHIGDGLARDERWSHLENTAALVVGNPPYVREKGNRELFERLRVAHPHLEEHFEPRMDLQYLFFHRSADLLAPGGRLAFLTTSYWLSATHACSVRADLSRRLVPRALIRVESDALFADAPGHQSLISVFERAEASSALAHAVSVSRTPGAWSELVAQTLAGENTCGESIYTHPGRAFEAGPWSPFTDRGTRQWAVRWRKRGTPVSELLVDRQGFVSGADRFSSRHPKRYPDGADVPTVGQPIFLFDRDECPKVLGAMEGTVVRPLLRASRLAPNEVVLVPAEDELALYVDGPVSGANEALLEEHLGQFRPVLERRREVRTGSMPWYRLHWPRRRCEQTGPKLVVPRRAPAPCFALDLSASCVSSDCTYLRAAHRTERPLEYLVTLMVALNSRPVERYVRNFGKTKGTQLEFYSEPLRTLPLPLSWRGGRLEWVDGLLENDQLDQLRARVVSILDQITGADR